MADHSNSATSSYLRNKISLKYSVQKRLLLRLFIAGTLISIVLAVTVFFLEFQRLGVLVNNRAGEFATRFNDEIRDLLDEPALTDTTALQSKLKMLSTIGKLNKEIGHLIYAGINDLDGNAIIIEKDTECSYMEEVDDIMNSREESQSTGADKIHKFQYINGSPHIRLTFPLTGNSGEQAATLTGIFAVSPAARSEVVGRIARAIFQSVGIVLLTTLVLYPIIITLVNRLSGLANNLLEANIETLQVLGSAIAKRDSDTDIHNYRVTIYSVTLAEAIGLKHSLIRTLIKGAFLHDVGKIGITDNILLKPGKLEKEEFEIMKRHVSYGIDIVERSAWLKDATDVVKYHHEQFSGGGYPSGHKGDSIPVTARIFAIADVFDALTSKRPYKAPMPFEEAMTILTGYRGVHFDPALLDTFSTIAKPLYEEVAACSDETLRETLESITRQYFSEEMYSS